MHIALKHTNTYKVKTITSDKQGALSVSASLQIIIVMFDFNDRDSL